MLADVTRKWIGILGEILITLGAVTLSYVGYTLWFTNTISEITTSSSAQRLVRQLDAGEPVVIETSEQAETEEAGQVLVPVKPFGLVYIPRLKSDVWEEPLVKGVYQRALASGIGYYPSTEMPGESGNFAIAGHRATHGEPFARFERLQQGDHVYIRTDQGWFQYELVRDKIVQPDEVWVLADNPKDQGFEPGDRLITLTTCDPRFNSYQRWIWWGKLTATYSHDETPAEIQGAG
ncbi:MAG: hypothetical protein RL068_963 [Actinomycetota bacterium]|jgi:sortase A